MRILMALMVLVTSLTPREGRTQAPYKLRIRISGEDTAVSPESLGIKTVFSSRNACIFYMKGLEQKMHMDGYIGFSIDSLGLGENSAQANIFPGRRFFWKEIIPVDEEAKLVLDMDDFSAKLFNGRPVDLQQLSVFRENVIRKLENSGYPFAAFRVDSIRIEGDSLSGRWILDRGPLYHIDSIRMEGNISISDAFVERYLDILPGSLYRKEKLENISKRLRELPFLRESQPWDLTMLGTGSILNLYLEARKSSQINALVGFLPSNTQLGGRMLISGEANINLRNALGRGETIGLNWQQLQVQSPRLNLFFQQPYIGGSRFGISTQFDLFRKDSSFLTLNWTAGVPYIIDQRQQGRLFFHAFRSTLTNVDTIGIKSTRKLPEFLDATLTSLGFDYQFNNTDYRRNPRRGRDISLQFSAGVRKIRRNNLISSISQDLSGAPFSGQSLYDTLRVGASAFRLSFQGAQHFQTGRLSTLRFGLRAGWIRAENIRRNEVFQIGGQRLLRGFDEESIFADRYAVGTLEFRYLMGMDSHLFLFSDLGVAGLDMNRRWSGSNYWGFGAGMTLETRAGLLNLVYAVGKQDDMPINFRQSKIHFGFVSIF